MQFSYRRREILAWVSTLIFSTSTSKRATAETQRFPIGEGHVVALPPRSVMSQGVQGDGKADDSAALSACFSAGGRWRVPAGIYRIAGKGLDSGGVLANLTQSLEVDCEKGATFVADDLDSDMIRFIIDERRARSDEINFIWRGGHFDQSNQMTSVVVPFAEKYGRKHPGVSKTTDGLSIRRSVDFRRESLYFNVTITGSSFLAGEHWQDGGGDSGIFVEGADQLTLMENTLSGHRDCGIYISSEGRWQRHRRCIIRNNIFENCFHGAAVKRSYSRFVISENLFRNCIRAINIEWLTGPGFNDCEIADNRMFNCSNLLRAQSCIRLSVVRNTGSNSVSLGARGNSLNLTRITAFQFDGCSSSNISNNRSDLMGSATIPGSVFIKFNDFIADGRRITSRENICSMNDFTNYAITDCAK